MADSGSLIGPYRIDYPIATGATATVYLAVSSTRPGPVALKVLHADLAHDPRFRERFTREARVTALLKHHNIVTALDRGETDTGQPWMALQYVPGTDAETASRAGTMTTPRALRIASGIADALDHCHERDVLHHDVKPGNILLTGDTATTERALLGDFGVARFIGLPDSPDDSVTVTATLAYSAPEVILGSYVDRRTDVYALGCTLFRLLTGRQPYQDAHAPTEVARAHLHQPPPKVSDFLPEATDELDAVIARALAKRPANRFASAGEMAEAARKAFNPTAAQTISHRRLPGWTPVAAPASRQPQRRPANPAWLAGTPPPAIPTRPAYQGSMPQ